MGNKKIHFSSILSGFGTFVLFFVLFFFMVYLLFEEPLIWFLEDMIEMMKDRLNQQRGHPKVFYDIRVVVYYCIDNNCLYTVKTVLERDSLLTPPFHCVPKSYIHTLRVFDMLTRAQLNKSFQWDDPFFVYIDGKRYLAPQFLENIVPPDEKSIKIKIWEFIMGMFW